MNDMTATAGGSFYLLHNSAIEYNLQQQCKAEQGQRTARLTPPKYRAVFGGAVSFLCHGFCKPTHLQHIYFF
jgi:hypothetical protein